MQGIKLDSLEKIEEWVPKLEAMLSKDDKAFAVGPKVVAPLAEAVVTLAREVRQLRDSDK